MTVQAIILAGGAGSRLGRLETQKCLLPIDRVPVLGHIMSALKEAFGNVELIIGIAYKADHVVEYVKYAKPTGTSVTFVPHNCGTEGWGIYREMKEYIK